MKRHTCVSCGYTIPPEELATLHIYVDHTAGRASLLLYRPFGEANWHFHQACAPGQDDLYSMYEHWRAHQKGHVAPEKVHAGPYETLRSEPTLTQREQVWRAIVTHYPDKQFTRADVKRLGFHHPPLDELETRGNIRVVTSQHRPDPLKMRRVNLYEVVKPPDEVS